MKRLPQILAGAAWILFSCFLPEEALAVTISSQTEVFSDQLITNKALQELGNNLTGTLGSFTFRVSSTKPNSDQFDFVVQNSRIFDKDNNNYSIIPCTAPNYNPNNPLDGITFNTEGVPAGYEDVTLDFSCRNYQLILGHRYLISFGSGNFNSYSGLMLLAGAKASANDLFTLGGARLSNGNKFDYSNNSGVCSGIYYTWGSTSAYHNGCYVWDNPNDDLYFILTNTAPPPPPPKLPVIFIPGIGGSELKANQDIVWSKEDGHGGTYSHGYTANEKVWVNQDEAQKIGDDDYFDILKLKADGVTSEADLSLTNNLTAFGYGDIESFFTDMGYAKDTNFFVFNYDWRKDIRNSKDSLDSLIEQAKTQSGQSKVNLVVHSMGGLIGRFYISDSTKAPKVNKLIELGVPHLGAVEALKTVRYGSWLGYDFRLFTIGIPPSETKDNAQNIPSMFELMPSMKYYDFYNNSDSDFPYPYKDDRDIDNNKVTGNLNYDQTKSLLSNLGYNMTVFGIGEQFHTALDSVFNQTSSVKVYEIIGTAQPTLGQIHETWWVTWPINLIPKTDEIYINGDDTVPLYSASLKNDSQDLSGVFKIYYVEQKHNDLVSSNGIAMQTVKSILNDDNSLPIEVKDQKISLEGEQISLDDGELDLYDDQNRHCGLNDKAEIEENIPEVICTTSNNTKHAFVKKKASKVKVKATRKNPKTSSKTTTLKKRTYKQDKISKTTVYKNISLNKSGKVEFDLDPALDTSPNLTYYPDSEKSDNTIINPTSEVAGSSALDQTAPGTTIQIAGTKDSSGIYNNPVTITLTGNDADSGILKIEYSLDNGITVQTYTGPFTISTEGKTTIQFKAIDNSGNEEIPQSIIIEIATTTTGGTTPASSSTETSTSSTNSSATLNTPEVSLNSPGVRAVTTPGESKPTPGVNGSVLGIKFENPSHISDEINVSHVLDELKNPEISKIKANSPEQILGGLLIVSGGIVTIASLGFALTFLHPVPK